MKISRITTIDSERIGSVTADKTIVGLPNKDTKLFSVEFEVVDGIGIKVTSPRGKTILPFHRIRTIECAE